MSNKPIDTSVLEDYLARWPHNAVEMIEAKAAEKSMKTGAPNLDCPEVFEQVTEFIVYLNDAIYAGAYTEMTRDEFLQRSWQAFWLRERARNAKRNMLP
jgi:hypothetical protein